MLEKVAEYVKNIPDIPFSELFRNYIMEVQDSNISSELLYLRKHNVDVLQIEQIVSKEADNCNENDYKEIKDVIQ